MQLTHSGMFLILAALLNARIAAAEEKVLTKIICKAHNAEEQEHFWTDIGITHFHDRIFGMDCQSDYCAGSDGIKGDWSYICGYEKKSLSELTDSTDIVVDIKTMASRSKETWSNSCAGPPGYRWVRAGQWDGDAYYDTWAKDSQGDTGTKNFALCYRLLTWREVKEYNSKVAVDIKAFTTEVDEKTTVMNKGLGYWDTHEYQHGNYAYGDEKHTNDLMYLYAQIKNVAIPKVFGDTYCYWGCR